MFVGSRRLRGGRHPVSVLPGGRGAEQSVGEIASGSHEAVLAIPRRALAADGALSVRVADADALDGWLHLLPDPVEGDEIPGGSTAEVRSRSLAYAPISAADSRGTLAIGLRSHTLDADGATSQVQWLQQGLEPAQAGDKARR